MIRTRRRGFTYVEVLIAFSVMGVLGTIGSLNFQRAEKRAKHSEAITNLKSLHASLMSQSTKPTSIHVPGFHPQRGNRYSYHLGPCTSCEDRSGEHAEQHPNDDCIGADTYEHPTLPNLFSPVTLPGVSWEGDAARLMNVQPGVYGTDTDWVYLAYAAGDLDDNPSDLADTWFVGSSDGLTYGICPASTESIQFVAGEPVQVVRDSECN